jgi:hypothetical protein
VGLAARERQVTNPDLTAVAFKRYMGSARTIKLGPESLYPEELSALVLRSLRADAEKFLGEPVTDAVITVPAYFNDRQRKATRRAARVAAQGREGGGSCDIKLPDDRNSISYSSDGSAPETFARVLRGAPG